MGNPGLNYNADRVFRGDRSENRLPDKDGLIYDY
jgi:hypothetical protein